MSNWIDTHAHLTHDPLTTTVAEVLDRALAHNVVQVITMGINITNSRESIALAGAYSPVFAACGIHPEDVDRIGATDLEQLPRLLKSPKVVALGEIGLDYKHGSRNHVKQQQVFRDQLTLAQELNLPVVLHNRDSFDDFYATLKPFAPLKGVWHSFTGTLEQAQQCLALGLLIGLNGILTFPSAKDLQQVATELPLDKILLETDAPFLAPQPVRGKTNEPCYIPMIGTKLAELQGIPVNKIAHQTTANARSLFSLPSL